MLLGRFFARQSSMPFWKSLLIYLAVADAIGTLLTCAALLALGRHISIGLWHGNVSIPSVIIWGCIGNVALQVARRWTLHRLTRRIAALKAAASGAAPD
jgi:hypothetical protein